MALTIRERRKKGRRDIEMQRDLSQCQTQPRREKSLGTRKGEPALSNKGMQGKENPRVSPQQADPDLHFRGGQGLAA